MNKNPPDLYESWEVDQAVSRFSMSASMMASRCLPSGMAASQFSMKVSAIAAAIYHEYQQGNASAKATIDALSKTEWQLRKQADLISRFGLETITLMMQKHGGGARFTTASVYRYAQSKEKPQMNGWDNWGRWTHAPHARKNLLLRYAAESYLDDLRDSDLRDKQHQSGGNSGGSDLSTSDTPPPHSPPQLHPDPEQKTLTVKERLARQRYDNYLASEKTAQILAARETAEKAQQALQKQAAKEKTIPQIFAKSACVPAGTCDVGTEREALSSVGHYGAYAAAIAQDSEGMVLSRIAGQALADIPGMAMKIIGRAGILAAFAPTKMGDGTLYSEEDIRTRKTVETNIRFGFDPSGKLYGYHVDGDPIPKRTVTQSGDKFAVTLGDGLTLEWIPMSGDLGGHPILINPIPDLERHDIWIHPQAAQGKEFDGTYITPVADADLNDYILVFPADTGLPPLYVVYHQIRRPNGQFGPSTEPKPSLDRPRLRAGTKQQIEAEAFKDENGNFTDANGNVLTDWQYGHRPSVENRRILKAADEMGMTQPELNDFVNEHPEYYQIEDRLINLSHVNEKPGSDELNKITREMKWFLKKRNTQ